MKLNSGWLFDLNDIVKHEMGEYSIQDVIPYAYGKFDAPFQTKNGTYAPVPGGMNPIKGGTYDAKSNTLYLLLYESDTSQGGEKLPVIVAYKIDLDIPSPPMPPSILLFMIR